MSCKWLPFFMKDSCPLSLLDFKSTLSIPEVSFLSDGSSILLLDRILSRSFLDPGNLGFAAV